MIGAQARRFEAIGYDGLYTAETQHDPFFPLVLAAEQTLAVFAFSPGITLVVLPPLQFLNMGIGAAASLYLVHRHGGLGAMFAFTGTKAPVVAA